MVDSAQHQKSDEEMTLAITNLQAMLDVEDVDLIIDLLQKNNWDTTQAANAYYAQQMQRNQQPQQQQNQQQQQQQYAPPEVDGVRAPMQFQQQQLIGGSNGQNNSGFFGGWNPLQQQEVDTDALQRQIAIQYARRLQSLQFTIVNSVDQFESMNNGQNGMDQNTQEPGVFGSLWNGVKYVGSSIWNVITLCAYPAVDDDHDFNLQSAALSGIFYKFYHERTNALADQEKKQLMSSVNLSNELNFPQICRMCRTSKKPMIIFIYKENKQECFDSMSNAISPQTAHLLQTNFNTVGYFYSDLPEELKTVVPWVSEESNCTAYFLQVDYNGAANLLRRAVDNRGELQSQEFYNFLDSCLNLYKIAIEEDPEYRQLQQLQDAGVIPLNLNDLAEIGYGQGYPQARASSVNSNMVQNHRPVNEASLMRQQQQMEYMEALREDERRQQQEQQEQVQRSQQIEEENRKEQERLQEEQRQAEEVREKQELVDAMKMSMPEEPAADDKDAAVVVFRMPETGQRIQRRFNKTDKVDLLYHYVSTLDELQLENKASGFQLLQAMPRKIYEDRNVTLEQAGLFPRAMLQVQEKEAE